LGLDHLEPQTNFTSISQAVENETWAMLRAEKYSADQAVGALRYACGSHEANHGTYDSDDCELAFFVARRNKAKPG
jgi:hypothetical protein